MENILNKLQVLKRTRSKLEKIKLLKLFLQNPLFKNVVLYAMNEQMQYGVKKLPDAVHVDATIKTDSIFKHLTLLSKTLGTNERDKQTLANMCSIPAWREVVTRIINKDLKCGCGVKTINAAYPDLIKSTPYQRCSTQEHISNLVYPAWSQRKADTMFGYFVLGHDDLPYTMSRKGNKFAFATNTFIDNALDSMSINLDDYVVFGELQVYVTSNGTAILDRKTGNGILNKALKGTISKEESNRVFIEVWDAVPEEDFWKGSCDIPYDERYQFLLENIDQCRELKIMPYTTVFNESEVYAETKHNIAIGNEGTITKNLKGLWKNNTSKDMIKGKEEKECEMRIISCLYGDEDKKYANCIGKFLCHSDEGLIIGTPGSGITDIERGIIGWDDENDPIIRDDIEEFMDDYIGRIITIKFNYLEQDKRTGVESLYLPRVEELRTDKDEADDAEYIRWL